MNSKFEVLCVDDEPQVLEGLRMHLKEYYTVHLATSGPEGLEKLLNHKSIAVILSDMRMPEMDGAKFLNAARTAAPEAVRMLLTGYADIQSAIAAVNEGQIFRFISKPCPPDQLLSVFEAAVTQHRLMVAEKVLLQRTLLGCVESMVKVLSLTKPAAFGRALRLRSKVHAIVRHLHWQDQWQIEAAAVLSQLGAVTLSEEALMKLNEGEPLDEDDCREVAASIDTSMQMLQEIPRLEPVIEILRYLAADMRAATSGTVSPGGAAEPPAGGQLLRIVLHWDTLEAQGYGQSEALEKISASDGGYDSQMLEMLRTIPAVAGAQSAVASVSLRELIPGVVLAEDLMRKNGVVILPRGFEIDRSLLDHIHTFADDLSDEPIKICTYA